MQSQVRLFLAAAITAVFLLISFSPNVHSEADTSIPACPVDLVKNGSFEIPIEEPDSDPLDWSTFDFQHNSQLSRDDVSAHSGVSSVRISSSTATYAWYEQVVTVEPNTQYMLTGWVKTENVSSGGGANLSLLSGWLHSEGLYGTNDWTRVNLQFNSGPTTQLTIGAQLGYFGNMSTGTVWFDDLRLTPIKADGTHPRWKILVLIYDIPALTSGNMIPELTIRYPDHPLTQLDRYDAAWWASPANTAADRSPDFDSVIVIWDPRVVDQYTGTPSWIGPAAGL